MYQRILVPIDGSPAAAAAVTESVAIAKLAGATVRLLHCMGSDAFVYGFETCSAYLNDVLPSLSERGHKLLKESAARVQACGVNVETVWVEDPKIRVAEAVMSEVRAWQPGLVVMGTKGKRGVSRLMLGSDAEDVARTCNVPVLMVHATPPCKCESCDNRACSNSGASLKLRIAPIIGK